VNERPEGKKAKKGEGRRGKVEGGR